MESYGTSGCIDLRVLDFGTTWRCDQLPVPADLSYSKEPPYSLDQSLGGLQNRSGRHGEREDLNLKGLELRSLDRSADSGSQSLYRPSYSDPPTTLLPTFNRYYLSLTFFVHDKLYLLKYCGM
jgi:hypothetical protein